MKSFSLSIVVTDFDVEPLPASDKSSGIHVLEKFEAATARAEAEVKEIIASVDWVGSAANQVTKMEIV